MPEFMSQADDFASVPLLGLQSSLSTDAARNLAHTTKSLPQMQSISSRWLLRILPWVQVSGGTYRVNRRLTYVNGDGRIDVDADGAGMRVIPGKLREIGLLRDFSDDDVLRAVAAAFEQREAAPGEVIARQGEDADRIVVVVHGKVDRTGTGEFATPASHGMLSRGDFFGAQALMPGATWESTFTATTPCTLMTLHRAAFEQLTARAPHLLAHLDQAAAREAPRTNRRGEADIEIASGHAGEPALPSTFVDYEPAPREYPLQVAQSVLRIHTRVADLYNGPMDQTEQQLRLIIEALRERQEHEMINHPAFGLLHNAAPQQRISTRSGPPTPDDMDELLSMRRQTKFFLAHRRTIAAFARECTRAGISEPGTEYNGHHVFAWRGVPFLPCNKIPISDGLTSSVIALRTGEDNGGVIGLHQQGIPDEYEPSLSVRFMGIDDRAVISYLVSAYYSVAVLLPSALGILENAEVGRYDEQTR